MIYQIAGHRAQSAPAGARHHRPAAGVLSSGFGRGARRRRRRAAAHDRARRELRRAGCRASSRADRSSGSASPGRWPPIPISSSATRSPRRSTRSSQEEILKLLLRLQKELGVSYLFITHDIATVKAIADEIVVMHQGKVVEQGPKPKVLSPPHSLHRASALVGARDGGRLARERARHAQDGRRRALK